MLNIMPEDTFEQRPYGKVALRKLGPVAENFRLFSVRWLGKKPEDWETMEVAGAEFRAAKSGPNKGKMTVRVKGSLRTAYVNKAEIAAARKEN